ncbi:hypothetical protein T459_14375 [Capsicum annuum]|uniref:Uncharacterized protein n=1 Tax=Capsicum annuum TaxID=4072 RepID=A0A2G2ZH95_CAPAN|nr:hypothetical protein T459_14375 [Capsicum annuum]
MVELMDESMSNEWEGPELIEEVFDIPQGEEELMTISLQTFTMAVGYQTIRITSYHEKRPLQVLIGTGSTHNFIDQGVAKKLGCNTSIIVEQSVSATAGTQVQTVSVYKNLQWLLQGTTFFSDFFCYPWVIWIMFWGCNG